MESKTLDKRDHYCARCKKFWSIRELHISSVHYPSGAPGITINVTCPVCKRCMRSVRLVRRAEVKLMLSYLEGNIHKQQRSKAEEQQRSKAI